MMYGGSAKAQQFISSVSLRKFANDGFEETLWCMSTEQNTWKERLVVFSQKSATWGQCTFHFSGRYSTTATSYHISNDFQANFQNEVIWLINTWKMHCKEAHKMLCAGSSRKQSACLSVSRLCGHQYPSEISWGSVCQRLRQGNLFWPRDRYLASFHIQTSAEATEGPSLNATPQDPYIE